MMLNLKRMIAVVLSVACLFAFSACEIMSPRNPQPSPSVELLDESDNQMDQNTDNIKENSDDGSATPDDERDNTEDSQTWIPLKNTSPYTWIRVLCTKAGNSMHTSMCILTTHRRVLSNSGSTASTQTVRVIEIDDNTIVRSCFVERSIIVKIC